MHPFHPQSNADEATPAQQALTELVRLLSVASRCNPDSADLRKQGVLRLSRTVSGAPEEVSGTLQEAQAAAHSAVWAYHAASDDVAVPGATYKQLRLVSFMMASVLCAVCFDIDAVLCGWNGTGCGGA